MGTASAGLVDIVLGNKLHTFGWWLPIPQVVPVTRERKEKGKVIEEPRNIKNLWRNFKFEDNPVLHPVHQVEDPGPRREDLPTGTRP